MENSSRNKGRFKKGVCQRRNIGKTNGRFKTGLCMNGKLNRLYVIWANMKQRCTNPKCPKFKNYGGKNITICPEWMDICNFSQWAYQNGYAENLTLDRIDNNKGYFPENCRWVDLRTNSRKRTNIKVTLEDAKKIRKQRDKSLKDLAKEYSCSLQTIRNILAGVSHIE